MISILFSSPLAFGQRVSIHDLAKKFDLQIIDLPTVEEHDLKGTNNGEFYQYTKPISGKTDFGLLRPMLDPSFSHTREGEPYPGNMITNGKVADSTANAFKNKLEQLARLRFYGGPSIMGLAKIPVGDGLYDLAIMVEHMEGQRIPLQVAERPFWLQSSFIEKFNSLYRKGFIPLDYKTDSLFFRPSGSLRLFDVVLATPAEMSRFAREDSGLAHLRRLQLTQSVFQMEETTKGDKSEEAARCRKIIGSLRGSYRNAITHEMKGVRINFAPAYSGAH
ncbi:MAG: hypothetical protein J0L93_04415 [Deltaproteobacteria bacterium]|nr:hypothetical protein [Deltaproteobacteria bacterium]